MDKENKKSSTKGDDKELTDQLYQAGSGSCDSKIHVIQPHAMSIAY